MVNAITNLRYLIIEAAFPDSERELAKLSKHFCPSLLLEELAKLASDPNIYVTHAKPGMFKQIETELLRGAGPRNIKMLMAESVFEF